MKHCFLAALRKLPLKERKLFPSYPKWFSGKYLCCIVLLVVHSFYAQAQAVYCPPNIDFESGNYGYWQFFTGSCCPINATTLSGAVANRHVLTSGTAVDPYGGFPVVAPGGGIYSLKLGNNSTGSQAERARYYIHVPATTGNYSLIYRYAVVFENPSGHPPAAQPRFEVKAYDSATNLPLSCAQYSYVSAANLPGFSLSNIGSDVWYKSWTTASLNLSGLAGKTIAVDFASGDCDYSAHFGYGYVDMSCSLFQIQAVNCTSAPTTTLNAPPGFQSYVWMDSSFSSIIDTGATIIIPTPGTSTQYHVILTPFTGFGCPDTLTTSITIANVGLTVSNDTMICANGSAPLLATGASIGVPSPLSYNWTPTTGLSCTSCSNPIATPNSSTTYQVTVSDNFGCQKTDSIRVDVSPLPVLSFSQTTADLCIGDSITLIAGGGEYYSWNPTPGWSNNTGDTVTASPTFTTTYTVTATDSNGCANTATQTVVVHPLPVITITPATAVLCAGESTLLTANGGVSYNWSPATGLSNTMYDTVTASPIATTIYTVTATDTNGCTNTSTQTVTVNPLPPPPAVVSQIDYCQNAVAAPLSAIGSTILWYSTATGGIGSAIPPTPSTATTGSTIYYVSQTINGCESPRAVITVTVNALPIISITPATATVCMGQSILLTANGGVSYNWSPTTGLSNTMYDTVTASPTFTTTYTVIGTDSNGCVQQDSATVFLRPQPMISAGANKTVCEDLPVQLQATGGISYVWSPVAYLSCTHCANPIAMPPQDITYSVIGTDAYGCTDSATISLQVIHHQPVSFSEDNSICMGASVLLSASGGDQYIWSPASDLSCADCSAPIAMPTTTTTYTVIIKQGDCFADTGRIHIHVLPQPIIDAGADQTVIDGGSVVLLATGTHTERYLWSPPDFLSCTDCPTPVANPTRTTVYTVTAYNGPCIAKDEVTVFVGCENNIFLSNTFTPNGDGLNDRFFPQRRSNMLIQRFAVFDRWGELVFEKNNFSPNDEQSGWDGTYKGKLLPPDVYVYILETLCDAGTPIQIKGDVALIR